MVYEKVAKGSRPIVFVIYSSASSEYIQTTVSDPLTGQINFCIILC